LGDRDEQRPSAFTNTCIGVEGLVKDAVVTAFSATEWDGPITINVSALVVYRAPGGTAFAQALEATGSVVTKEGKPVGTELTGKHLQVRIGYAGSSVWQDCHVRQQVDRSKPVRDRIDGLTYERPSMEKRGGFGPAF
jgi:hypothetical protein